MTTQEAFKKLLEQEEAITLAPKVKKSPSRLRQLLSDINNKQEYPGTDLMMEILEASEKFEIVQPIKWEEKK